MDAIRRLVQEIIRWFRPVQPGPSKLLPAEARLLEIDGFAPAGFSVGVEILNDDKTRWTS